MAAVILTKYYREYDMELGTSTDTVSVKNNRQTTYKVTSGMV